MRYIAYSSSGLRSKNEDAYYGNDNLFIVCDGVGGWAYGEVASKLACSSISDYFKANPAESFDSEYMGKALRYAVKQFQEAEAKYPELKNMATTVVLAAFDLNGASLAWLGDSRLYHIREGQILFVTEDHSLVNNLLKQGHTNEEELKNIRNFITNSLSAKNRGNFSIHKISGQEIRQSDFFFLCTDGVLENITPEKIKNIFSGVANLEILKTAILNECEGKTKDNFTFEIIQPI